MTLPTFGCSTAPPFKAEGIIFKFDNPCPEQNPRKEVYFRIGAFYNLNWDHETTLHTYRSNGLFVLLGRLVSHDARPAQTVGPDEYP
jgi:hypothetical protein